MNDFEDKELWDLLGKSPTATASPLFTQKVLQAISSEEQFSPVQEKKVFSFSQLFRNQGKWIAACAACLAIVCAIPFLITSESNSSSLAAQTGSESYELAALEETALVFEDISSPNSLMEVAYCYSDLLTDDEIQYVVALL